MEARQIPLFKPFVPESAGPAVLSVLYSGFIGEGPLTERFEKGLQEFLQWPYAAVVNSGTTAIKLALKLAGVNQGDEVITTAQTCWATTSAILNSGAIPVWADTEREFCNISVDDVAHRITSKTKAVIVVHWGGQPVNVERLRGLIPSNIKIIQDCAHSLGSTLNGKHLPSFGDFCCYSFQAIKHICVGSDGGLVSVPDEATYKRAKLLRWFGISREDKTKLALRCDDNIKENGDKYHLNDFCSSIGLEQLKYLDETLRMVRETAAFYDQELVGVKNIIALPPSPKDGTNSAYWLYTLRVARREEFIKVLTKKGIGCNKVHERNDLNDVVKEYRTNLPNLDLLQHEQVSIPVHRFVSKEDSRYIVDAIKSGW